MIIIHNNIVGVWYEQLNPMSCYDNKISQQTNDTSIGYQVLLDTRCGIILATALEIGRLSAESVGTNHDRFPKPIQCGVQQFVYKFNC
jgi:hypothetical protein